MPRYSATALDHCENPRHTGPLPGATARGQQGRPGAGNYMVIELVIADERIERIAFQTYGCPGVICCGSMLCELALGLSVGEARAIDPDDVLAALGRIPLGKHPCAGLAVGALRDALEAASPPAEPPDLAPAPSQD